LEYIENQLKFASYFAYLIENEGFPIRSKIRLDYAGELVNTV